MLEGRIEDMGWWMEESEEGGTSQGKGKEGWGIDDCDSRGVISALDKRLCCNGCSLLCNGRSLLLFVMLYRTRHTSVAKCGFLIWGPLFSFVCRVERRSPGGGAGHGGRIFKSGENESKTRFWNLDAVGSGEQGPRAYSHATWRYAGIGDLKRARHDCRRYR